MKSTITKALFAGTSALAVAALLTACSGGGSSSGSASSGSQATMPAQMTSITLALNPAAQMAPVYYGIEQGIFKKHNLDVSIVPQTDVAAIVSGVASGQYTFGFATVVHDINANLNNIQIRAVATPDGQQDPNEKPDVGNALVAGPGSGITSAGQLAGKTLCVIGLSSLNTLAAYAMAADDGVSNPKESIQLVQLPFGQMPQALSSKQCDAAVIQSPFIAQAEAIGGTIIGKPNVQIFSNEAIGLFNTMQSYIDQHPDVVKAFVDAVVESQEAAKASIPAAQQTLVSNLNITPEQAAQSFWGTADPYVNTAGFATAQDLLMKYAGQTTKLDVDTLVWPGGLEPGK